MVPNADLLSSNMAHLILELKHDDLGFRNNPNKHKHNPRYLFDTVAKLTRNQAYF